MTDKQFLIAVGFVITLTSFFGVIIAYLVVFRWRL